MSYLIFMMLFAPIKKLITVTLLCFVTQVVLYAQTTPIPDSNFELALIDLGIDTNGFNGSILDIDATHILSLDIYSKDISSLSGIEAFTSLKFLDIFNNHLEEIDLSQNIFLEFLDAEENSLSDINLANNTALKELYVSGNIFESLNVESNLNLEFLSCNLNKIEILDVSNNLNLISLLCYDNNIDNLNVSNNLNLESLFCSNNDLSSLDVSHNILLKTLSCGDNGIENLILTSNPALTYLDFTYNNINTLDISNNNLLDRILCNNNNLTELNTSSLNNLFLLFAQSNSITSFNFCQNSSLKYFRGNSNNLKSIDVRNNNSHNISIFSVTQNPNLSCIFVNDVDSSYLANWQIDYTANFVADLNECAALTIPEKKLLSFKMYPNPAQDEISISLNYEQAILKLYNVSGQLLFEKEINQDGESVALQNISSGIYLVNITSSIFSETKKLIIK